MGIRILPQLLCGRDAQVQRELNMKYSPHSCAHLVIFYSLRVILPKEAEHLEDNDRPFTVLTIVWQVWDISPLCQHISLNVFFISRRKNHCEDRGKYSDVCAKQKSQEVHYRVLVFAWKIISFIIKENYFEELWPLPPCSAEIAIVPRLAAIRSASTSIEYMLLTHPLTNTQFVVQHILPCSEIWPTSKDFSFTPLVVWIELHQRN